VNSEEAAIPTQEPASLLWTLEDISQLVSHSGNPTETLTNIVHLIQRRFVTDVCSVYLLEPDRANLVLAATVGLRPESVGKVRMRVTEGLAGLVAEQARPVFVQDASAHPRFKYFRDIGEDAYRTFLGVPIMDRGVLQGVLVVGGDHQGVALLELPHRRRVNLELARRDLRVNDLLQADDDLHACSYFSR